MGLYSRPQEWAGAALLDAPRRARGRVSHISGQLAEEHVLRRYEDMGYELYARRWRGKGGEIDLILRHGDCFVFVEVKRAISHAAAAERLNRRQMDRICDAACEFCVTLPQGQLTEMRFDAALVDGMGRVEILDNAFGRD